MKQIITKLRHIILFSILVGSDLFIGFFGHYQGTGSEDFISYLSSVSISDLFPVFFIAILVVMIVEFMFRGN